MDKHKHDRQADHLELMAKYIEETMLKVTQTQHLMQEVVNGRDMMETRVQTLTTDFSNLQVATKKNEGHTRELQVKSISEEPSGSTIIFENVMLMQKIMKS